MSLVLWVLGGVTACSTAAFLTARLIEWTRALGVVDTPNARSSHTRVTPRGGGLAIVAVVVVAAAGAIAAWPAAARQLLAVITPAVVVSAVSWFDDIKPLPNRVRFGVHIAAAAATACLIGPLERIRLGDTMSFDVGVLAWPLTLLWITGMTNAFNFMDGIDGIAGITAAAAGGAIAAVALAVSSPAVAAVALAFAAAALGFLRSNWPPARIFMGDVGSAFCGFLIAALPFALPRDNWPRAVPAVAFTMWPFIFDATFTLARRALRRENIFQSHRSHIYQRLVIGGWSHRAVSALYGGLAAMAATIAAVPFIDPMLRRPCERAAFATLALGICLLLGLVRVVERPRNESLEPV